MLCKEADEDLWAGSWRTCESLLLSSHPATGQEFGIAWKQTHGLTVKPKAFFFLNAERVPPASASQPRSREGRRPSACLRLTPVRTPRETNATFHFFPFSFLRVFFSFQFSRVADAELEYNHPVKTVTYPWSSGTSRHCEAETARTSVQTNWYFPLRQTDTRGSDSL